jgi:hypothetical protein
MLSGSNAKGQRTESLETKLVLIVERLVATLKY